jgi:eukaryotic-like serine/threonine-protein kinase
MPGWKVPGYTELRALGSGGFGDVVLARHDESGTLVAVKYLRRELLADPGFAAMFRGEAAVLASLDDPNVVRLYEYLESPSGAAIVMELIDGVSVREILSRQGATTGEAALVVLQGSLLGLAAAHRRGVVHRDYKPENVLVNGAGVSKLTDFGIAARAGDRPVPAGTLAYAPPEQLGGSPASPAGDVYAATATFYECLTGQPPFAGDSAERLLYQHLSEPVPLDPVPGPLRPLVTAGLAKDPGTRPADAARFVTELRAVAGDAYGPDWERRGRQALGEAALLLAALWPAGAVPAVQGGTVEQVNLPRSPQESPESRHLWHLRHVAHLRHLRHLRALMAVAAVAAVGAVAAIVIVTTGSSHPHSGSPGASAARSASVASTASAPGSPRTASSSAAAGLVTATLPVVSCPTFLGVSHPPVSLPRSRSAVVPQALAAGLSVYADTQGIMELLGPKGWSCTANYGADGSGGVTLYPPGTGPQSPVAIDGSQTSACVGCALAQACPLFPSAARAYRSDFGQACPAQRPAAETVMTIAAGIVTFEDPPGVKGDGRPSGGQYPADGVMTYPSNLDDGSWQETCTLPPSEKNTCTAVLKAFITWYGQR